MTALLALLVLSRFEGVTVICRKGVGRFPISL